MSNEDIEWIDQNGYPTEEALEEINLFDFKPGKLEEYFAMIKKAWKYPESIKVEDGVYRVSTFGYPGCEDIIEAMQGNHMFWVLCWWQSRRGGHYIFADQTKCWDDIFPFE